MTSVLDANVHNLAIDGTFDDCQGIVKALFKDLAFRDRHHLGAVNSINWARVRAQIMEVVKASFRPEFLNRLDEVVMFNRLDRSDMERIVDIQMVRVDRRLAERRLIVRLSDAARRHLAEAGWDPVYGARPLKRAIEKELLNPLAQEILKGRLKEGAVVVVGAGPEGLTFSEAD